MATDDNKRKIVETALQMFNSRGLRGVTMDDIAAAMRMSKRTLYETFSTKEELLAECLMQVHDAIENRHKQIYKRVDEPVLVALYMLRVNALQNQNYHHLIEESKRYYPEIYDRFFKLHTTSLRTMVTQALDYAETNHYLRPNVDKETTADFLCKSIQAHRLTEIDNREEYSRKVSEIGFTFLRGLMSTDAIARYEKREEEFRKLLEDLKLEE